MNKDKELNNFEEILKNIRRRNSSKAGAILEQNFTIYSNSIKYNLIAKLRCAHSQFT